jgi:hypothetical protein
MQKCKFTFAGTDFLSFFLEYFSGVSVNFSIAAIISILKNLEKVKIKYYFLFFLYQMRIYTQSSYKIIKICLNLANLCRKNKYLPDYLF